jgi:hypothetical protein
MSTTEAQRIFTLTQTTAQQALNIAYEPTLPTHAMKLEALAHLLFDYVDRRREGWTPPPAASQPLPSPPPQTSQENPRPRHH